MLNRLLTIGITLFWLAMMTTLARREILPALRAARETSGAPNYRQLEALAVRPRAWQMGIFLSGKRIGQALSRIRMSGQELRLDSKTQIRLSLSSNNAPQFGGGPGGLDILIRFNARVLQGELLDFRLTLSNGPGAAPMAIIDGVPIGKKLQLRVRHGGQTDIQTMPFNAKEMISTGYAQAFAPKGLEIGKTWQIRTLDPFSRAVRVSTAEVVGREAVTVDGRSVEAFRIRVPYGTSEMNIWAAEDGEVLRQEMFGFVFLKESPPSDALERRSL